MVQPCSEIASTRKYDRGEHRHKHCWNHPYAGFVPGTRGPIGKCSNRISDEEAQNLLDSGEVWTAGGSKIEVYNVFDGVPYVATSKNGAPFHGYPWSGEMPEVVRLALEQRAETAGHIEIFRRWVKQHTKDKNRRPRLDH